MQSIFRLPKVVTLTPGYIYTKMRQLKKPIALWDFVIDLERKVGGANCIYKHERLRI
jgi:hypothetical protein